MITESSGNIFEDLGVPLDRKDRRRMKLIRKHKEKDAWHEQRKARDYA